MNTTCNLHLINAALPLNKEAALYEMVAVNGRWASIVEQQGYKYDEPDFIPLQALSAQVFGSWKVQGEVLRIDLQGKLLIPGFVDAHLHMDKAYSLSRVPKNSSSTLLEAIHNYQGAAPTFSKEEIKGRIRKTALRALSYGTTSMRSHLDFNIGAGAEVAMRTIEAALEVKEEFKDFLLLQFFPIYPYFPYSDKVLELFEETLRMGVDGIGGAPHLSSTPEENIDLIFKMAARYDKPIDLHSDESDDPQIQTVSIIADQTVKYGFQGRVTVGHLCSLSAIEQVRANVLIRKIADARLNVVTLPAANMYLQGRNDQGLIRRGTTRINELLEAGVSLASASDNIQDPFHPYGRGDMVQIGLLTAYVAHLGSEADMRNLLQMITATPAGILGHLQYEVQVGNPVKFVIIDAQTIDELFTEQPVGRWVYSNAQWIHGSFQTSSWGTDRLNQLWKLVENNPYTC